MRVSRASAVTTAAVAAAALLLGGCSDGGSGSVGKSGGRSGGSGSDSDSDSDSSDGGGSGGGDAGAEETGGTGGSDGPAATGLDGVWAGTGAQSEMVFQAGNGVAMLTSSQWACVGSATEAGGHAALVLQCPEATTDYSRGMAESDGQTLTVAWESVGEEHQYVRIADATDFAGLDLENLDPEDLDVSELDLDIPGADDVEIPDLSDLEIPTE